MAPDQTRLAEDKRASLFVRSVSDEGEVFKRLEPADFGRRLDNAAEWRLHLKMKLILIVDYINDKKIELFL